MSRRGAVASIVSFVLSFASVGHAEAQDPSAHCSLMWPVVQREFSPERSWQLRGEAFSFSRTGDGPPEFQVLCHGHCRLPSMLHIVRPSSQEFPHALD